MLLISERQQPRVRDSWVVLQVEGLQLWHPRSNKRVDLIGLCNTYARKESHLYLYPGRLIEWLTALTCFQQHNLAKWMRLNSLRSDTDHSRFWFRHRRPSPHIGTVQLICSVTPFSPLLLGQWTLLTIIFRYNSFIFNHFSFRIM